jgi:hypothetical protein
MNRNLKAVAFPYHRQELPVEPFLLERFPGGVRFQREIENGLVYIADQPGLSQFGRELGSPENGRAIGELGHILGK